MTEEALVSRGLLADAAGAQARTGGQDSCYESAENDAPSRRKARRRASWRKGCDVSSGVDRSGAAASGAREKRPPPVGGRGGV